MGVGASLFKPVLTEKAQQEKGPRARSTKRGQVRLRPRHNRTPELLSPCRVAGAQSQSRLHAGTTAR